MPNTLIINGSPRKNGGTAAIIQLLQKQLKGKITVIDAYTCGVSPCTDCRACWKKPGCVISDSMQEHYKHIDKADSIIIASPIYFAELTGPLLSWASRLQCLWTAKRFLKSPPLCEKTRLGGVVLVDGGDGYMDSALAMGKRLLRVMGAEYKEYIYFSGTDYTEPATPENNPEIAKQIAQMCRVLNREK